MTSAALWGLSWLSGADGLQHVWRRSQEKRSKWQITNCLVSSAKASLQLILCKSRGQHTGEVTYRFFRGGKITRHACARYKFGGPVLKPCKTAIIWGSARTWSQLYPPPASEHSIGDKSWSENSFWLDREPDTFSVIPDKLIVGKVSLGKGKQRPMRTNMLPNSTECTTMGPDFNLIHHPSLVIPMNAKLRKLGAMHLVPPVCSTWYNKLN